MTISHAALCKVNRRSIEVLEVLLELLKLI